MDQSIVVQRYGKNNFPLTYCPNTSTIGFPMLPFGSIICSNEERVGAISTTCTSLLLTSCFIPHPMNTRGMCESYCAHAPCDVPERRGVLPNQGWSAISCLAQLCQRLQPLTIFSRSGAGTSIFRFCCTSKTYVIPPSALSEL